ncbi:MAG: signal peptide peptidase SppA [Planctomycetes bacterium]|nr:signal peptide peptidase SppA [Planctomycetota bacterium]
MVSETEIFGESWDETGQEEAEAVHVVPSSAPTLQAERPRGSALGRFVSRALMVLGVLFLVNVAVSVVIMAVKGPAALMGGGGIEKHVVREGDPKSVIAIVPLHGFIEAGDYMGKGAAAGFLDKLKALEKESNLKAVIVSVDSPGGGATMSDVVHHRLGDVKVPKVALLGNLAASGGYYVAAGCDRIVAHPTTITGSIGVIMQFPQVKGLMDKVGLDVVTVKSGPHKDLLSMYRRPDDEEMAILQKTVDAVYGRFVDVVSAGRNMEVEKVKALADGRVFAAADALDAGLVDAIGYREEAIKVAEELAGVSDAMVVEYGTRASIMNMIGFDAGGGDPLSAAAARMLNVEGPMYIYRGPAY